MEAATDKAIAEQKLIAELFIHRLKMVDVSHHKDNPRYHNRDQIEQIAQSIRDHGYAKGSMVVQRRSMSLVAGNGVYDALILLGYEEADFIVMDMDDTESLQFMIRDNRLSELSEWDLPVLNADLAQLKDEGFELEDVGFELEAINELEELDARREADNRVVVEDDPPEVDEGEPVTQYGDLWLLGPHRVLCGDSTKAEDVERVMDGEKADMVFTDPPYGVGYSGQTQSMFYDGAAGKERKAIVGDQGTAVSASTIEAALSHTQSPIYCIWCAPQYNHLINQLLVEAGCRVFVVIVWNKNHANFGAMGARYKPKFETLVMAVSDKIPWHGPDNEVTVWDCDRASKNEFHPTQKPVELCGRAITNHTLQDEAIIDPFLGSGTTLIAADQLDRICYGLEIAPKYCDVIVKRYINHIGSAEGVTVQRNGKTLTWEQAQKADRVKVA